MKKLFLILPFLALFFPKVTFAEEKINKFGIHILEPQDLPKAQELVNSNGGDWGWVTIVIREDDLNYQKWQDFMDQCRERHLVPIVRIATHIENSVWVSPKKEDKEKWFNFLNSLNWPARDQYVIFFNEPNHAKEWGGEVNPYQYAETFQEFALKFKTNPNFKILNAGLDLAASNTKETMESLEFMEKMNQKIPGIFELLDGWVSHSYPNHGFIGKPWDSGKHSIRGYEWEINILKTKFNLSKDLPVFITETGWPKEEPKFKQVKKGSKIYQVKLPTKYHDPQTTANFFKYAFENIWLKDPKIYAVTPFVLNYPGELFADFSWLKTDKDPYPQYEEVKKIPKFSWWPPQEEKIELISLVIPSFMPTNTTFNGKILLKNTGQWIIGEKEKEFSSQTQKDLSVSNLKLPENQKIYPNQTFTLDFTLKTGTQSGEIEFTWEKLPPQKIKVLTPSIISNAKYTFWEKIFLNLKKYYLQITSRFVF